ncbi:N-alpha-acetyltransferase 25, NatB auxiliary subunit [Geranomyces variabilis]|uniref:N-alpha-acetyltransferase 25, NatB auxiliary subunit n=1 Tax=Geranomyces variabilis TaxID=109894 RepID=A0AAD5XQT6_9FUNG|nr:N-alpha-acetyltransferase 25, NatB auxiliary subunit [Geranomyces variabilis]
MSALDRQLRPIYEALDSYNNKQAVALCTKALKKGENQTIKALKAVALDRLGKEDEALEICDEIKRTRPTDDAVLQYICMVYKASKKTQDVIDVYTAAYNQAPRNEELANHWFMALVRVDDRKQMQQAAMKIQKQFKDNSRYLFWTIMTIWLQRVRQAKNGPEGTKGMLATLTERMLIKAAEDGRIKDYEALQLYIEVLETHGKTTDALAVINGEMGNLCKVQADRKHIVARLCKANKSWGPLRAVSKELLLASPDDWLSYCNYIEALIQILRETTDADSRSNIIEQARSLFSVLESKASSGKRTKRGPLLAGLELEKALQTNKLQEADLPKLSGLVMEYLEKFGSNLSCFDDVRPYLSLVPANDFDGLFQELQKIDAKGLTIASVRRLVTIEKIRRWSDTKLTADEANARAEHYIAAYKATVPLGADFDERELQPGDDYILLLAHTLLDRHAQKRGVFFAVVYQSRGDFACSSDTAAEDRSMLADVAAVLEYGLARSKFNYQIKLLLIRVYVELGKKLFLDIVLSIDAMRIDICAGVHKRMFDVAKTMDIKQIQHDTLSYLFTDDIELLGCPETSLRALVTSLTIYGSNERETPEMIVQAFKFGTYSKIPEFIRFRDRLKNSLQYNVSQRQLYRVEILRRFPALDNLGYYLEILDENILSFSDDYISKLSDNRDLTLLANWTSSGKPIGEVVSGTAFPRKRDAWLKLHALIPLILRGMCTEGAPLPADDLTDLKRAINEAQEQNEDSEQLTAADILLEVAGAVVAARTHADTSASPGKWDSKTWTGILDRLKRASFHPFESILLRLFA